MIANFHLTRFDGTYLPWSSDFRKHILFTYPLPEGLSPIPPEIALPAKYKLVRCDNLRDQDPNIEDSEDMAPKFSNLFFKRSVSSISLHPQLQCCIVSIVRSFNTSATLTCTLVDLHWTIC